MNVTHDVPVAVIARHLGVSPSTLRRRMRVLHEGGWRPGPTPQALETDRLVETMFFPGTHVDKVLKYLHAAEISIDLCVYVITCDQVRLYCVDLVFPSLSY